MKKGLLVLLGFVFFALPARAQRISGNLGFFGGDMGTHFTYPDTPQETGRRANADGLAASVSASITDSFGVGYRFQRRGFRNEKTFNEFGGSRDEWPTTLVGGHSRYSEVFGSFPIPAIGHSLVAGAAWQEISRTSLAFTPPTLAKLPATYRHYEQIEMVGPVVGLAGERTSGKLTFEYAGRLYPRMSRTDSWDQELWPNETRVDKTSMGFDLSGSATYWFSRHIGLNGGYTYRRYQTDMIGRWSSDEALTDKGFVLGLGFSF